MEKMNLINGIQYIPEVFIVLVAIYWFLDGLLATSNINYLMLAVILFMSLLVILKNKTTTFFCLKTSRKQYRKFKISFYFLHGILIAKLALRSDFIHQELLNVIDTKKEAHRNHC